MICLAKKSGFEKILMQLRDHESLRLNTEVVTMYINWPEQNNELACFKQIVFVYLWLNKVQKAQF